MSEMTDLQQERPDPNEGAEIEPQDEEKAAAFAQDAEPEDGIEAEQQPETHSEEVDSGEVDSGEDGVPQSEPAPETKQWYIVHTYSGFERKVAESLRTRADAF